MSAHTEHLDVVMGNMPGPTEKCLERRALEGVIVEHIRASHISKGANRRPARDAERRAARKLEVHIKEHGCK